MRILILILAFFMSFGLQAQKRKYSPKGGKYGGSKTKYRTTSSTLKRNPTDVFPLDADFRLSGWYGALGATYMLPMKSGEGDERVTLNDTTSRYVFEGKPKGKIGPYLEIGYFRALQYPSLIHFWDVGLSYRQYKGEEEFNGTTTVISDSTGFSTSYPTSQTNTYTDQAVSLTASIANQWHFSRYGFIQNALGLNVDYFFSTDRSTGPNPFSGYNPIFHDDLMAQLHYRLGVGWKASRTILVVPSITLPVITAWPFDGLRSSLDYFSTRQYPIIISIRVMFLRPLSEDCNVPNYDGPSNFGG